MMQYLLYYCSKQADPWFASQWHEVWIQDADACCLVIVDLDTRQRYWNGEWTACDVMDGEGNGNG
jgi:hypothetical protein